MDVITVVASGTSVILSALLLPESSVGKSVWLRIAFGLIYTMIAISTVYGIAKLMRLIPARLGAALIGAWVLLAWCVYNVLSAFVILPFSTSWHLTVAASLLISLFVLAIFGVLLVAITTHPRIAVIIIPSVIAMSAVFLLHSETTSQRFEYTDACLFSDAPSRLGAPIPATPGKFKVRRLSYGSGTDMHRPEYGTQADLITKPVDASPFVPNGWSVARTTYWGFDQTQLPINGRVWAPDGLGPFPLVLIVHGARPMVEFSDGGFGYLGNLLASRGFIVASVDENFLNYGGIRYGDFNESDIDARGWLLLQHLKVWKDWSKDRKSVFYGRVDMDRIALIGHSRGGEAITAAASFNRMGRYPKKGSITFGFHFTIRALIALAPSDIAQPSYERTTPAELKDINYLVLLGTRDRQVPSIIGSRVYQRVNCNVQMEENCRTSNDKQSNREYYFKSALYIYNANHSQFNSDWGIYDFSWPSRLLTDIDEQMSGEDQRHITKLYVSAFLEATLNGDKRYIPLFRDYHLAESWLPKTSYISRFQDTNFKAIADFDEDIDPQTTTLPGGKIVGKDLQLWREQDIDYHYYLPFGSRSNRVISVGWDADGHQTPLLGFQLPEQQVRSWKLKPTHMLLFSLANRNQQTTPDMKIQLTDKFGHMAKLSVSQITSLPQTMHYTLTKLTFLEEPSPVMVLQTVSIPLASFLNFNPLLDLTRLREIDFLFSQDKPGSLLIDDVGIEN